MRNLVIIFFAIAIVFCSCDKQSTNVQKIKSEKDCVSCNNCNWHCGRVTIRENSSFYIITQISGTISCKCAKGYNFPFVITGVNSSYVNKGDVISGHVNKNQNVGFRSLLNDDYSYWNDCSDEIVLKDIKIVWDGASEQEEEDFDF